LGGTPEVGSRISIHDNFRVSIVDSREAEAARDRRSLGEVDLKDALAKVTEDDAPRWMVVKHGMDHGPFSGRQLVDMYKRGELEISGSAGILPVPKPGSRRSGGGGGGGGGGMSYEDAMMQAVDIGGAGTSAGEQTLTAGTVAGVMNKNLNPLYNACVKGSVGKVTVDIAIAGSGQVLGVTVNAGDAGFQRCVADQVRRIRFPSFSAPRMGARYSFNT
jgi:hypothetical protein